MRVSRRGFLKKAMMLPAVLGAAALGITALPVAADEDPLEEVLAEEKLIRIRPADDNREDKLRVSFKAERSRYKVNQTIRFKVKGNKRFYLLLFNIDPRTKKGVAILPNRYQTAAQIKYPGGEWYTVPNENLEFYADRPGVERVIMVASEKYIDSDRLLRRARSKSLGDFFELESPLEALDDAFQEAFGEKRIRVRERGGRLPKGLVVKEVNLRIR